MNVNTSTFLAVSILALCSLSTTAEARESAVPDSASAIEILDRKIGDLKTEFRLRITASEFLSKATLFDERMPQGRRVLPNDRIQSGLEFSTLRPELGVEVSNWETGAHTEFSKEEVEDLLSTLIRLRKRLSDRAHKTGK